MPNTYLLHCLDARGSAAIREAKFAPISLHPMQVLMQEAR